MHPHGQIFFHHRHTTATALRRAAWVNLDRRDLFRFVARRGSELIPRSIRNTFRQTVIFQHPRDVQLHPVYYRTLVLATAQAAEAEKALISQG
jgi:hypothetical protein